MSKPVKKVLKKIFPLPLLQRAQLKVNKIRIDTLDPILFPEENIPHEDFFIQRDEYPFRLYAINSAHLVPRLKEQFTVKKYNWTQDEYLLFYKKPCIIEPRYGWALSTNRKLIYASLGFSRVSYLGKPEFKSKFINDANLEEHEELISLRDTGEENYYHFYNDVLAKLFFLQDTLNLSTDIPILISKSLYDKKYFQYFLSHPYLSQRKWVIQDKQYIRSKRTYFCKPLTHTPHYYSRILDLIRSEDNTLSSSTELRLFITRNPKRLRFIENNSEVEILCKEFGFESIDFDELSLPQQIRLMGQARYVVAIHGAGLTNMLFRGEKQLGLLEIFPPADYFPFHYILMANQLNYQYDGIIGQPGKHPFSGGFRVDIDELRNHLGSLIQP